MTARERVRAGAAALLAGVVLALALALAAPRRIDFDLGGREPVGLEGLHAPEGMYARTARWSDGAARLEWPGQYGVRPQVVEIELAPFFGRTRDQIEITVGPRVVRHRLESDWHVVRVPATDHDQALVVEIRSAVHEALPDPRPLGVRLDRISIENSGRGLPFGSPGAGGAAILVALGAAA